MLSKWSQDAKTPTAERAAAARAVARVQGASGAPLCWTVTGPLTSGEAAPLAERWAAAPSFTEKQLEVKGPWRTLPSIGTESRVSPGTASAGAAAPTFLAYTDLDISEPASAQFLGGSSGAWRVWLNGKPVYQRDSTAAFQADSQRFEAPLAKGANRVLVEITAAKPEFQLRFRRKSSRAEHEQLAQAALTRQGNPDRGRKLLLDAEKSQCLKCHRWGDQGERIGPELTGLGSRFSRMHVIESLLEPSRAIAPSFQTVSLLLEDGRALTGLILSEQDGMLTLADNQGRKHALARSDVRRQEPSPLSTMPDGLEKRLTAEEFVDLVTFLTAQKQ
jgi:putative heme-binding domain-containing protein